MLPMIVNVNLTKGTKTLAKKKTLVKNIQAIQNLGAIDVLCTDKTGTLTLDKIVLQKYINVEGKEDLSILEYAFLNSYYSTGMKNLVDKAVITYGVQHKIKEQVINYEKIDEIPFDYIRKKVSIVVKHDDHYRIITKGALEEVLKSCNQVKIDGEHKELTQEMIQNINKNAENLAKQGMQVIALASKREYRGKDIFNSDDEKEMTFIGFVAFLDPPKKEVKSTIKKLKEYGISLLNYAIKDIPFFRKIVISGNTEPITNFNLIKCFINYSKKSLLSINFSKNNFSDVIGANIFASIGINCPNIQIIDVSHNYFTYSTFNHKKVQTSFEIGFKNLSKLMLGSNILGTRGFVELCGVLKNCPKLNLLDVSYNGMDKNIFENEKVAEIFGDSLPNLYTFYYEGNYLPTDEIQNLVKNMLNNNSLTYLYLPNNQIGDDSLEILAFLLSKNYNIHTLDLSYNKFTSKGVKNLCNGIVSKDSRLIELSLSNNNLDETSLTYLSDAINKSEQLYCVDLSYNNFSKGDCGKIICDIIKRDTKLKNLNLTACHLGLKTKEIFAALENNQTITYIDLSVNDIGNNTEMFKALAKMLQKNMNIKYLYLDTNYITDKDFDIIINEGIAKSVNLNYLSLKSNKISLSSIKKLSDSIKKDNKKLLEQYLKKLPLSQMRMIKKIIKLFFQKILV